MTTAPRPEPDTYAALRARLDALLEYGLADQPLEHARQVAVTAGVLHAAFDLVGLRCVLTGGSALEVHVPGVYKSADLDVVIEGRLGKPVRDRLAPVFDALGFAPVDRHWARNDLFVEVPGHEVDGPTELVRAGGFELHIPAATNLYAFLRV